MKAIGEYINSEMDWDRFKIETDEYGNASGIYRPEGDIGKEVIMEKMKIDARKNDYYPAQVCTIMIANQLKKINIKKVHILELEYPEQQFKYNPQTGKEERIESEKEKEIRAKLTGKVE